MLALKLAFKNLFGAGLRTWLNVMVLSFVFVLMVFYNGMIDGWNRQGINDTIDWEIGQGQYWQKNYDKYDPFSFEDAHQVLSDQILSEVSKGTLCPVLIRQATIYPQGRMQSVIIKGIDINQKLLKIPTVDLKNLQLQNKAIIGRRMAEATKLNVGDEVVVRWRDKNGTFDARSFTIAAIFKCDVPSIDNGQMYLSLDLLQEMTAMENQATYLVSGVEGEAFKFENWVYKDKDWLLTDFKAIVQSEKGSGIVILFMLLLIALLAIFDTQVLSIFRRQKEIGTYLALGLTRTQVVGIFTVEGGAHSILAAFVGVLWGTPLLVYIQTIGISFGAYGDDMGITMSKTIFPYYSFGLVATIVSIVIISSTIVSYLPSRKIAKMEPTAALRGKLQ